MELIDTIIKALLRRDREAIDIYGNAGRALANGQLQANLRKATSTAVLKRNEAAAVSETFESSRDAAVASRNSSIPRLRELTAEFAANAEKNGVKTFIFDDYESAAAKIIDLIKARGADLIVKSKSMLTEEMGLNARLSNAAIETVETDLGEFIVSVAGEKPSHLTAPALHKSRREIAELFSEKLGMSYSENAEELSYFARRYLREKFRTARVGLTGANFAVADSGLIAVVENEANARLSVTLPRTHIAVFGAEKIVERLTDLPHFLNVLSKSATGQLLNAYTSVLGAPGEGRERFFIIITRNRFKIADDPVFREALRCVRCGACQNICPVFRRLSGHGYEFAYAGPIGTVLAPFFEGYRRTAEWLDASTLCGFCRSVCPMKIDLPRLILEHRARLSNDPRAGTSAFRLAKRSLSRIHSLVMSNRVLSRLAAPAARLYFAAARKIFGKNYIPLWSVFSKRDFIGHAKKTFMERHFRK